MNQSAAASTAPPLSRSSLPMRLARGLASEHLILLVAAAYFLVLWPLLPELATPANVTQLFLSMLPLLAVAIGQTVVLITGGIDLSVPAIIAAASVVGGRVALWGGESTGGIVAAIAAMLFIGAAIGLLNGLAITLLVMPPFIVTLSMSLCIGGATLWLTRSTNTPILPDRFTNLGFESFHGVPYSLLIVLVFGLIVHGLLARTLLGRWIYAVGHNIKAARISGVPVRRATIAAYVLSGVGAAVGSLLYTTRLQSGQPTLGKDVLLDVIGAAVIGGASLLGGKGKVIGTIYGVLLFALIDKTLDLKGLTFFTIMMVKGAVIVAAALLDVLRTRVLGGR